MSLSRESRARFVGAFLCVVAAVLGLLTAPPAAAATTPLAPVGLHPDGTVASSERYVTSPVRFEAQPSDTDPVGFSSAEHYQVQHLDGTTWTTVINTVGTTSDQYSVADGDARWRVRLEAPDGTPGPWSAWIRFTVDDRRPADPTVTLPPGQLTIGVPLKVTVTSPDGRATMLYLSRQDVAVIPVRGQDPCTILGMVCLAAGQRTVTVPWTFLDDGFGFLYVTAYGRSGLESATVRTETGLLATDDAALTNATRWTIPITAGGATTIKDPIHGRQLRVAPHLAVTTQQLYVGGGGNNRAEGAADMVDIPSAVLAGGVTMRTLAQVVDTSTAFTIGAVLEVPTGPHGDLVVVDQAGADGSAFTLTLNASHFWNFCLTRTDGRSACSHLQSPEGPGASDLVVGRYDPVQATLSLATPEWYDATGGSFGVVGTERAGDGALRFGVAVPRPQRYEGPVGSPFIAPGWLTARQATNLVTGSTGTGVA